MGQPIRFLLNGGERVVEGVAPTTTVLEHLRRTERLTGTKEGCAEGDCGACTVLLAEPDGAGGLRRRAVNACIQFLPVLHGRAVETIEAVAGAHGQALQAEMVARHASQCGFCTPGFVMQLYAGWLNGALGDRAAVKDQLAGNLCRCTGYGPIIDAGVAAGLMPRPDLAASDAVLAARLAAMAGSGTFDYASGGGQWFTPRDADALAALYLAQPQATLVAGASDVGLWVTKQHRALPVLIDVTRVAELARIEPAGDGLRIGAGVTHAAAAEALGAWHPDLAELWRRFAGAQVRAVGTVGGNIANGSPIGDLPPALIALGARLHLRRGGERRVLPLEEFFVAYGRQDRRPGEFVVAVEVPGLGAGDVFFCHKISKRFDSDISAVLAAFRLTLAGRVVRVARLAFGGMAGTPMRARGAEAALEGRIFDAAAVEAAAAALAGDFTPLSDMRASAGYRLTVAQNLLRRFLIEHQGGVATRIEDVA